MKRNQPLGVTKNQKIHFRKDIKSMRGDLGTLGVILGATLGGVREMSLFF